MPQAAGAFVTSVTQDRFLPKVVDNVLDGNVLAMRLLERQRPWIGGESLKIPVNLEAYTQLGSYAGFDTFSTAQQNTRQKASFDPSQSYISLTVSGIQRALNQGEAAVVDLIAVEMDQRGRDLADDLGTQFYSDGTGNNAKDFVGLQAAVDDSTNVTTYGGLSRSTYTNWQGNLTAQAGALALSDLAADFDAAQHGNNAPTLGITTPAVFTIYEALLTSTVQHNFSMNDFRMTRDGMVRVGGTVAANQGFRALTFRGVPVVADEKCTAQNLYFLNEKHIAFHGIPQVDEDKRLIKNNFYWTGWKKPVNQDAMTGQILIYGQLATDQPRVHSRRTGISS